MTDYLNQPHKVGISVIQYYDNLYTGLITFVGKDKDGEALVYSVSTDCSMETAEKTAITVYTSIMNLYHNISSKVLILNRDGKKKHTIDLQTIIDNFKSTVNFEDFNDTPRILH